MGTTDEDEWSPEGLQDRSSYEESVRGWMKMYTAGNKSPETKLPTSEFPDSEYIMEKVSRIKWPRQVRSYVAGKGLCVGLLAGKDDVPYVWKQKKDIDARRDQVIK